jgi:hypothetical protein
MVLTAKAPNDILSFFFEDLLHTFFAFYTWVLWPPFCSKWTYVGLVLVGVISMERPMKYLEIVANEMKLILEVQDVKRLMGLQVNQDDVKRGHSLKY